MFAGAKGGSSSFKQTPDNLRSNDTFEGVLGLGIGPFKGPTRGLKSIKVDGTAIENETGQSNFQDFVATLGDGDPLKFPQRVQLKLGAGAAPTQVGLSLPNEGGGNPIWITKTLPNTNADFIDLRFIVQQLYRQDAKGIYTENATLEIQLKPVGSTTWINPTIGTPTGTYQEQGFDFDDGFGSLVRLFLPRLLYTQSGAYAPQSPNYVISGKTSSPAVYELRIAVPNTGAYANTAWDVRIRLLERESYVGGKDNADQEKRQISWESMAAVYSTVLGEPEDWRGVAWLQLYGKASDQLTGVPEITGEYDTKIIKVPAGVYNPETRQYTGSVWDGSWAKAFTTDPAWIINDAISDELSGISLIAPGSYLNKWDALDLSKWCSELVPDGNGGTHPRYSLNLAISQPQKAEEFVRYLAGAVGALAWDQGDGEWRVKVDKADAPVDLFTLDNIEDQFIYSHTDVDTRFNDIIGQFKNAEMDYRPDAVQLYDNPSIALLGRKPTTIALVGCTNRQEALRRVKLRLRATVNENRIVTFTTNRRGRNIEQLSTILIADGDLGDQDKRTTGRTVAVATDRKSIVVRDPMYVAPGVAYTMRFTIPNPGYTPETATQPTNGDWTKPTIVLSRNVTNTSGQRGSVTTIYLDEALPDSIADNLSVALEATNLPTLPRLFRVTSVMPQDDGERISISAINIDTGKWAASDNVSKQDTVFQDLRGEVPSPTVIPGAPLISLLRVPVEQGSIVNLQANWVRPPGAFISGFRIQYSVNGGALQTAVERQQLTMWELPNAGPGTYHVEISTIDRRGGYSLPLVGDLEVTQSLLDATEIRYIDPISGLPTNTVNELQPATPRATEGSPVNTKIGGTYNPFTGGQDGGKLAQSVITDQATHAAQIGGLISTYGTTVSSAESAAAAAASRAAADLAASAAGIARGLSEAARDQSQQARNLANDAAALATGQAAITTGDRVATDAAKLAAQAAQGVAEQARNQAQAAALSADGSASAASGSASSAAASSGQAGQSASAAVATSLTVKLTAAALLPATMIDNGAYFTTVLLGAPADVPALTGVAQTADGPAYPANASGFVATRGTVPYAGGRVFEVEARVRCTAASGQTPIAMLYGAVLGADYNLLPGQVDGYSMSEAVPTPQGVVTIIKRRVTLPEAQAGGVHVRFGALVNRHPVNIGQVLSDASVSVIALAVRDATEVDAAEKSASASAASAVAANVSRNAAGVQASIATTERIGAQTAASEAFGYRDQAFNSETNAAGSASSAATQAGIATAARNDATGAATNAQTYRNEALQSRNDAQGAASTAVTQAGIATDASSAASGSASSAAGSASTATSRATEAGTSAAAAAASAIAANSSAGAAGVSASQAATSETNAAGSASSAVTQAGISASAADRAQLALADTLPMAFTPKGFSLTGVGAPSSLPDLPAGFYTSSYYQDASQSDQRYAIFMRGVVPHEQGRVYRPTVRIVTGDTPTYQPRFLLWAVYLDANFNYIGEGVADLDYRVASFTEQTVSSLLSVGAVEGVPLGANVPGAKWIRFGLLFNRQIDGAPMAGAFSRITQLYARDVTETHTSALSATAAALSASSATASSTAAGQHASAANTSKINADTARSQAEGFRNEAVQAKNDASGSASTAATQAGIAASASLDTRLSLAKGFPEAFSPSAFSTGWVLSNATPENQLATFPLPEGWATSSYYQNPAGTDQRAGQLAMVGLVPYEAGRVVELTMDRYSVAGAPHDGFYAVLYDAALNFFAEVILETGPTAPPVTRKLRVAIATPQTGVPVTLNVPGARFIRFGALINRNAGGGVFQNGAATVLTRLFPRDVTQEVVAGLAATAASGSASTASASATAAGQSAGAALASKTAAETAKGQAEAFRNEAATSKSDAAGSAAAALVSEGIAVQARDVSSLRAAAQFPPTIQADFFTQDIYSPPALTPGLPLARIQQTQYGPVFASRSDGSVEALTHRAAYAYKAGDKYDVSALLWPTASSSGSPAAALHVFYINASGSIVTESVVVAPTPTPVGPFTELSTRFTLPSIAGATTVRFMLFFNGNPANVYAGGLAGATTSVVRLEVRNATALAAAEAFASAANTSAGTANAASGAAGGHASAANTARLAAEGARDTAGGHASSAGIAKDEAVQASTNAALSAASASLSAITSASTNARTITRNPAFAGLSNSPPTLPTGWAHWNTPPTLSDRMVLDGDAAWRIRAEAGQATGFVATEASAATRGFYVIEGAFQVLDGTSSGAAIIISLQTVTAEYGSMTLPLSALRDAQGRTPAQAPNFTRFRFSQIVELPDDQMRRIQLVHAANWAGTGETLAYKQLAWFSLGLRPASEEERIAKAAIPSLQASVSTQQTAITTLQGAAATYEVVASASGSTPAAVRLRAGVGGSNVDVVSERVALRNPVNGQIKDALVVQNGDVTISGDLYAGNGRIIFNNGTYMVVHGIGFGVGNQLLEWYGTTRAVATCSPENAISFKAVDGRERMGGALNSGVVGYDQLTLGAVQKCAFYSLPNNVSVPKGQTVSIVSVTFMKEDADSVLEILMYANVSSPDDLQFTGRITVDGEIVQTSNVNIVLDTANSNGQMPITPSVFLPGVAAGGRTVAFTLTNNESDNIPLTVLAGSTIKVNELRKGSIGSSTGSGAAPLPPPPPPTGEPGGGTGDGGGGYNGQNPIP